MIDIDWLDIPASVIPALSRDPVDARLRGGKSFFQPKDLGWLDSGSRPE
ncbi:MULTISPECIES: hypothetical protein [Agrobacterium]|nr:MULTISPECIES: hypothetical protein [Agrobacterium]